jgi:hypothetical protein
MKKLIVFAVFPIFLSCPALAGDIGSLDGGRSNPLDFMSLPMNAAAAASGADKEIKLEGSQTEMERKQKEARDKKVDDAIKKAWGDK